MLLSFIVDLKINEDNQVQILEFGPMQHAGFSGYKQVTGKDMREDIVYPFFEKAWQGPVVHIEDHQNSFVQNVVNYINQPLSKEHDKDGDVLFVGKYGWYLTGVKIYDSKYLDGFEYMNGSGSFMMLNQNKAYFDLMASKYGADFPMPAHTSMVRRYSKDAVEDVLMNRVNASEYVIKAPDTAQGRGTMVVSRDDMDAVLKGICRKSERGNSQLPISSTWNHASPLITIQEKVKSRPTEHKGKSYDGTMRVAMTVWKDQDDKLRHEIHGAYWKMPRNPIGEGDYQEQVISCSPHYDRLSDKFLRHSNPAETFAPVSDQDMYLVGAQLSTHLPNFVEGVAKIDLRRKLMPSLLNPEREDLMALAAMTYADVHYDGHVPSPFNSAGLKLSFDLPNATKKARHTVTYRIPCPLRDTQIESDIIDHCKDKPRGAVAAFISALHRRTLENNGYAIINMKHVTSKVREMRRPACSFPPVPHITILEPKEFVCDVKVLDDNAPKL